MIISKSTSVCLLIFLFSWFCYHASFNHFLSSHTVNLPADELFWHYLIYIFFLLSTGFWCSYFCNMSEIALHRVFLIICCVTSFATLILVFGTLNEIVYKLNIVTTNEVLAHDGSRLLGLQLQSQDSSIPWGQRDVQMKEEGNKPWRTWLYTASREQSFFLLGCVSDLPVLSQQLQGHVTTDFPPAGYTRNVQEKVMLHSANDEATRSQTSFSIHPLHETPSSH